MCLIISNINYIFYINSCMTYLYIKYFRAQCLFYIHFFQIFWSLFSSFQYIMDTLMTMMGNWKRDETKLFSLSKHPITLLYSSFRLVLLSFWSTFSFSLIFFLLIFLCLLPHYHSQRLFIVIFTPPSRSFFKHLFGCHSRVSSCKRVFLSTKHSSAIPLHLKHHGVLFSDAPDINSMSQPTFIQLLKRFQTCTRLS